MQTKLCCCNDEKNQQRQKTRSEIADKNYETRMYLPWIKSGI